MLDKYKVLRTAEKYVLDRKFAQAVGEYRKLVEQDPEEPSLLNTLGDLLVRQGQTEQALECYRRVADIYLQGGFTVKASAMFKKILSVQPEDARSRTKLAELYEKQGLLFDAARELKALVAIHEAADRHEQALNLLKKLMSLVPEESENWVRRARLFARRDNADAAMSHFAEAIRLDRVRGDFDAAFETAREALAYKPNDHASLQELVEVGDQSGRLAEVEAFLEEQLESEGKEYPFWMFLGLVRERLGDVEGAGEIYKTLQTQGFSDPIISQGLVRTGQAVVFEDAPGADVELPSEEAGIFPAEDTAEPALEADDFTIDLNEFAAGAEQPPWAPPEEMEASPAAEERGGEPTEPSPPIEEFALDLPEAEQAPPGEDLFQAAPEAAAPETAAPEPPAPETAAGETVSPEPAAPEPEPPPEAPADVGKLWAIPLETEPEEEAPTESSGLFSGEMATGDLDVFSVEPPLHDDLFAPEEVELEEFQDESLQVGQPEIASLEEALEEVDFYLKLGFRDDGKQLLEKLLAEFPGDERVLRRARKVIPVEDLEKFKPKAPAAVASEGSDFEDEIETALGGLFAGAEEEVESEEVLRYEVGSAASDQESSNPDLHYNLGLAYKEMGLVDDAIQEFLKADEMLHDAPHSPQKILCCSMLANSYLQLNDHRRAAVWAREGLAIPEKKDFEQKALEYDLALALEGQGKLDEAMSLFEAILSRDKGYRDVAERAKRLRTRTQ